MMLFCANNPISKKFNVEEMTPGKLINGCKEKLDGYTWGSRIYILIYAPGWNEDPYKLDIIGTSSENPITARSKEGSMSLADGGCNGFIETGPDHGLFFGSIKLSGFKHDITGDGRPDVFGGNRCHKGNSIIDDGSGRVEAKQDGGVTVSFEYSENKLISKTAYYSWREGTLDFDKPEYLMSDKVHLTLTDLDNTRWPFDNKKSYDVHVYSDSDKAGIIMDAYWVANYKGIVQMNGHYPLQFFLTDNDKSEDSNNAFGKGSGLLRVSVGDTIYAEYIDRTLPAPYTTNDEKTIIATVNVVDPKDQSITILDNPSEFTENTSEIIPSDHSFKKYTPDGKFLISFWLDSKNPYSNKEHELNLMISEARTQKIQENITYDLEILLNNDVVLYKQKQHSSSGHLMEKIYFDEIGIADVIISNINDEFTQQNFKLNVLSQSPYDIISELDIINTVEFSTEKITHAQNISDDLVVPDWIKKNAKWWSEGQISDVNF